MGTITVEEPKSIVESVEKYECDSCGSIEDSDSDMYTVFVYDGVLQKESLEKEKRNNFTRYPALDFTNLTRKRLLCEHCSAEASNKQLENSAESAVTSISMGSVILASSLGLLVYHLLTFTPVVIQKTTIDSTMDLFIVIAASFIIVSLISIVCFAGIVWMWSILLRRLSSDSVKINFEKQQY